MCRALIMLDWREREHEEVDEAAINHQPSLDALRGCGLYKYWAIPGVITKSLLRAATKQDFM